MYLWVSMPTSMFQNSFGMSCLPGFQHIFGATTKVLLMGKQTGEEGIVYQAVEYYKPLGGRGGTGIGHRAYESIVSCTFNSLQMPRVAPHAVACSLNSRVSCNFRDDLFHSSQDGLWNPELVPICFLWNKDDMILVSLIWLNWILRSLNAEHAVRRWDRSLSLTLKPFHFKKFPSPSGRSGCFFSGSAINDFRYSNRSTATPLTNRKRIRALFKTVAAICFLRLFHTQINLVGG